MKNTITIFKLALHVVTLFGYFALCSCNFSEDRTNNGLSSVNTQSISWLSELLKKLQLLKNMKQTHGIIGTLEADPIRSGFLFPEKFYPMESRMKYDQLPATNGENDMVRDEDLQKRDGIDGSNGVYVPKISNVDFQTILKRREKLYGSNLCKFMLVPRGGRLPQTNKRQHWSRGFCGLSPGGKR